MRGWKGSLKGIYDVGRFTPQNPGYRQCPFGHNPKGRRFSGWQVLSVSAPSFIKEVGTEIEPDDAMERIFNVGGFPEPFLENQQEFYGRWKKPYPGGEEVRRVAYYLANLNLKD